MEPRALKEPTGFGNSDVHAASADAHVTRGQRVRSCGCHTADNAATKVTVGSTLTQKKEGRKEEEKGKEKGKREYEEGILRQGKMKV